MPKPFSNSLLWWLSGLIAAMAVLAVYYIQNDPFIMDARQKIILVVIAAGTGIGVCMICATAQWWMKR